MINQRIYNIFGWINRKVKNKSLYDNFVAKKYCYDTGYNISNNIYNDYLS